jgi:transposase InsO family protein
MGHLSTGAPLDRVATDVLGPLPLTPRGNRYILLVTDHFSKWVEIFPIPNQTAATIAEKILEEVIGRLGCPLTIHSDQGSNYESAIIKELCQLLEIKKTRTSPKNPRCNGLAERFNRTLLRMIKAFLKGQQTDWDLHLGCLAAAYRATPSATTGLTPNVIMLGREVRLPAELVYNCSSAENLTSYGDYVDILRERMKRAHEVTREHTKTAVQRQKDSYDTRLAYTSYRPGDIVWYLNETRVVEISPKLQDLYRGPCVVTRKLNNVNFEIQLDSQGRRRVVHHNKLKIYTGTNPPKWAHRALRGKQI